MCNITSSINGGMHIKLEVQNVFFSRNRFPSFPSTRYFTLLHFVIPGQLPSFVMHSKEPLLRLVWYISKNQSAQLLQDFKWLFWLVLFQKSLISETSELKYRTRLLFYYKALFPVKKIVWVKMPQNGKCFQLSLFLEVYSFSFKGKNEKCHRDYIYSSVSQLCFRLYTI